MIGHKILKHKKRIVNLKLDITRLVGLIENGVDTGFTLIAEHQAISSILADATTQLLACRKRVDDMRNDASTSIIAMAVAEEESADAAYRQALKNEKASRDILKEHNSQLMIIVNDRKRLTSEYHNLVQSAGNILAGSISHY